MCRCRATAGIRTRGKRRRPAGVAHLEELGGEAADVESAEEDGLKELLQSGTRRKDLDGVGSVVVLRPWFLWEKRRWHTPVSIPVGCAARRLEERRRHGREVSATVVKGWVQRKKKFRENFSEIAEEEMGSGRRRLEGEKGRRS